MGKRSLADYFIQKITSGNIAYQAVLKQFPFHPRAFWRCLLSLWSIFRSRETSFYPVFLGIESTAKCNLRCDFCPRTEFLSRDVGHMDFDFFCKVTMRSTRFLSRCPSSESRCCIPASPT